MTAMHGSYRAVEPRRRSGEHNAGQNGSLVTPELARGVDERRELGQRFCYRKERMPQQLRRIWPLFGVNLERLGEVIAKRRGHVLRIGDGRRAVRNDQMHCLQGIFVDEGWFTLYHFCVTGRRRLESAHVRESREYIPIAMIPRDHMSTLGPHSLRVTTSGAIQ